MRHLLQKRHAGQTDLFDGFRRRMGDIFQEFFGELETSPFYKSDFIPRIDVEDQGTKFVVRAEIPGAKKDEVEVELKKNILTIKGEKKAETTSGDPARSFLRERTFGAFERSFSLPAGVNGDEAKASFKDGVLTVEIPRIEEKKTQNRIAVE